MQSASEYLHRLVKNYIFARRSYPTNVSEQNHEISHAVNLNVSSQKQEMPGIHNSEYHLINVKDFYNQQIYSCL